MSEARIAFYGTASKVFHETARQVDVEGAVRSGKTTVCLTKVLASCQTHPGIFWLICRFSDDDTHKLLKPLWRTIALKAGIVLQWNAEEGYDEFPNGSRVYITGLKTQDQTNPFRKFRGLTLAGVYNDQSEELPHEVYQELVLRLSQNGYPHQIILSPQTVGEDHWITDEFPHDRPLKANRAYYPLATHDNAHNLPPNYIREMEEAHPPGTPMHSTLILGRRGAQIVGDAGERQSRGGVPALTARGAVRVRPEAGAGGGARFREASPVYRGAPGVTGGADAVSRGHSRPGFALGPVSRGGAAVVAAVVPGGGGDELVL